MKNVYVLKNPIVKTILTDLRNIETKSYEFMQKVELISYFLAYEVSKQLKLKKYPIQTPLSKTTGFKIKSKVVMCTVLRAGNGILPGFQKVFEFSSSSFLGLKRNEETLETIYYYQNIVAPSSKDDIVIILDPMFATGNTLLKSIELVREKGYENIIYCGIVGTQYAIDKVLKIYPDIKIYLCDIDPKLLENGYIYPGLGDFGDRLYNT